MGRFKVQSSVHKCALRRARGTRGKPRERADAVPGTRYRRSTAAFCVSRVVRYSAEGREVIRHTIVYYRTICAPVFLHHTKNNTQSWGEATRKLCAAAMPSFEVMGEDVATPETKTEPKAAATSGGDATANPYFKGEAREQEAPQAQQQQAGAVSVVRQVVLMVLLAFLLVNNYRNYSARPVTMPPRPLRS